MTEQNSNLTEIIEDVSELQLFWKNLYKKYFDLDIDVSLIKEKEGKWVIFIAKGLTIQQVYDALPFGKGNAVSTDLDTAVSINDRTSNKDYVLYVEQSVNANKKCNNTLRGGPGKINHKGITLMERLLLEIFYFESKKDNLDVDSLTVCSGSLCNDKHNHVFPYVGSHDGKIYLGEFNADESYDFFLRSREVFLK